jgi:hypothetical protein
VVGFEAAALRVQEVREMVNAVLAAPAMEFSAPPAWLVEDSCGEQPPQHEAGHQGARHKPAAVVEAVGSLVGLRE